MVTVLGRQTFLRGIRLGHNAPPFQQIIHHRGLKSSSRVPNFGFAFDIDGVLLRSSNPLPGAREALLSLQKQSIPFILLTNGGGKLEADRVKELSSALDVDIDESIFIQSHTPYADLVEENDLRNKHILVIGGEGEKCRKVAESYGFQNVIIPSDIFHACPEVWPFSKPFVEYHASAARPLPLPLFTPTKQDQMPVQGKHLKIDAIFVYNDPRDMGLDTQLVIDLLLSHEGYLGTISKDNGRKDLPNHGYQASSQPGLYFANPDLLWAAQYHLPRLGSGAFKASLVGLWKAITGSSALELRNITGGKPNRLAYEFADLKLGELWAQMYGQAPAGSKLQRVYMVGDNLASDIIGANQFKSHHDRSWISYLVKSGVWNGQEPSKDIERPKEIVDGVKEAVEAVLRKENWSTDFQGL